MSRTRFRVNLLSGSGFQSRFCHLNVKYRACFLQGFLGIQVTNIQHGVIILNSLYTVCSILFIFNKGLTELIIMIYLVDELM